MSGVAGVTTTTFFAKVGAWIAGSKAAQIAITAIKVLTVVAGVKGFMQARDMLGKGQDIMANKTAAGGKIPVVYGTRRVGAQIVYMDTAGNASTHLYVVYALSVGSCEEIMGQTIELSGNSLRDSKQFRNGGYIGTDKISSGNGSLCTANQNSGSVDLSAGSFGTNPALGGYRYVMNLHHGAASQAADPMLRASIGSKWTTAHKLNGVAYIAASYIYDSKGQFRSVPQLTVQVKGKKVFDPRDNSTAWSSNPALCFLDLIQNNDYGKGLATSQINMATFSTAANKADTEVNSPYFNGDPKALTWSGSSGDNFIKVLGGAANILWWQNKVGDLIDLYDTNGNGVIDGAEITALQRDQFFDENAEYLVFFDGTLSSNYSSQSGTSEVKVKRFHCNAYIDCNKNVMENSKELLANMRGIFTYVDGKYELQIEDTGSSTFSINDNHIIADSGISVDYGNKDKKANKVIVEFFNANKSYELDTATVYHEATTDSNDFTSDDGGEVLEVKAEFPYTTSAYIAYNHAKTILTRSRHQTSIQFLGTPEMYKLNCGDIVDLTYAPLGFGGKIFIVEAIQLQPNGLVSISMLEYFDVYTWTVPPQEAVEALANIPSAYAVKAPTSLAFTDTDDSNTGRPFLAWALPSDYPYYQWRINVKDAAGNQQINRIVDVNNCDLNFLPVDANYVASVTALNTTGVESSAATLTFTIGDAPTGTPDIKNAAIVTDKLGNGSVTNVKVNDLSAAKINTGELNLGTANGMAVKQGKSGYTDNSTTGLWLGNDGGTTKLNIGSASKYLRFDGTNLLVAGDISASTGTISTSIAIGSGNNIFKADANGIYLGNASFGSAPFKVAMNGGLVATSATITGTLTANNINTSMFQYVGGNLIIKDDAITRAKIVDDAINNALIATDAVNQDSIAANSITAVKIVARAIDASRITAGTLTSASGVFGVISANNITTGTLNATNVAVTNLNASNITTGDLNANRIKIDDVTIDTDGNGNLIIKSAGVDTNQLANGAVETAKIGDAQITTAKIGDAQITNAKIDNLNATKITAGSLDSARINVDTLAVKKFANVSSTIISQTGGSFPLEVFGSVFQRESTNFSTQTTSTGTYLALAIGSVRNGAKYRAILSGVYGDCSGGFLEYSINGSNYVQAAGGIQSIAFGAGTFRTYVIVYSGSISGMSSSQSTVSWRLRWTGQLRSTYQSLYVFIDNTQ